MRHVLTVFTIFVFLCSARDADAQFLATDDRPEFITLSTSTTSAVVAGVIMLTVVNVKKDPTAMYRYLRQNEPAVRAALALGGGAVIDDIGAFFGVGELELPRFATLLRTHRQALTRAAFVDDDAAGFAQLVQLAMYYDRRLHRR